jgi:hypothetical protein
MTSRSARLGQSRGECERIAPDAETPRAGRGRRGKNKVKASTPIHPQSGAQVRNQACSLIERGYNVIRLARARPTTAGREDEVEYNRQKPTSRRPSKQRAGKGARKVLQSSPPSVVGPPSSQSAPSIVTQ